MYDVCILGGGAAGLAAAASLDGSLKKCIVEKNEIPGRKLMATGGGRCNITNAACGGKAVTLDFFKSIGIETYEDGEGRIFPYSNYAPDVVRALEEAALRKKADIFTGFAVSKAEKSLDGAFIISGDRGSLKSRTVIMAVGGKAAPQMGTTGDGYIMARKFGHSVSRTYPILTALECGEFSDIKGVRARGEASLYRDGERIATERGEIQFTADGISGICVMNLSMYIKADRDEPVKEALKRYRVELDLAPDFSREEAEARESSFGILSQRLAARVPKEIMKAWSLPVKGVKGWRNAQCTAGGVSLDEVDENTMESKLVPGLYFAGEILDIQGPCGGFNLQNAWETAIKAAAHINERLRAG